MESPKCSVKVSACILSWNTFKTVKQTIEVLREELKDVPSEIIVVDNGSTGGTVEYLKGLPDVIPVLNKENFGNSTARNQFIDLARGSFIFSIDGDVVPPRNAVNLMLEKLEKNDCIDAIGFHWQFSEPDESKAPKEIIRLETFLEDQVASFTCGMFRKRVFDYCRFDEQGFGGPGWGYEDMDFMKQMLEQGMVMLTIKSKFFHTLNSSIPQLDNLKEVNKRREEYYKRKWNL